MHQRMQKLLGTLTSLATALEKGACAAAIKANNAKVDAASIYRAECCYSVLYGSLAVWPLPSHL